MELLKSIKTASQPIPVIQQFVQTVQDNPEDIILIITRLFQSLKTHDEIPRAKMALALSQLVKRMKRDLNPKEIYELSYQTNEMGTSTIALRYQTVGLFMSWAALSRAGLFVGNKEIILSMIRNCHGCANDCASLRPIGYQTLWAVVDSNFKTTEDFKEYAFNELKAELGPILAPPHADSFEFWLKVVRKYEGLTLKPWVNTPTAASILKSLASVYESTTSLLPNIHTLWRYLAKLDSIQLVRNSVAIWGKDVPQIPMIAITVACDEVDVSTFLNIFKQNADFLRSINDLEHVQILREAAVKAADRFAKASPHRIDALAAALVSTLSTKTVSNFVSKLNDEQTLEVIAKLEGSPFFAYMQLLWAQLYRDSLEDTQIIKTIFEKMVELRDKEDEDQLSELITFFSQAVGKVTGDGTSWLSLLAQTEPIPVTLIQDEKSILKTIDLTLNAVNQLHKLIEDEHETGKAQNVEELVQTGLKLLENKCQFCQTVARHIIALAFPLLSDEQFEAVSSDPYVLVKASVSNKFCKQAIPKLITISKKLPRSILNYSDRLQIDTDSETSFEIVKTIIDKAPSSNAFIAHIFTNLLAKLTDEQRKEVVNIVIKHNFEHLASTETDFIIPYLKYGKESASNLLDAILASAKTDDKPAYIRRYRDWLLDATSRHDLEPEKIGHVLEVIADFPIDNSNSTKNKQEETTRWMIEFLRQQRQVIPLFGLEEKLNQLSNSKSRNAKTNAELILKIQKQNVKENE